MKISVITLHTVSTITVQSYKLMRATQQVLEELDVKSNLSIIVEKLILTPQQLKKYYKVKQRS